MKIYVIEEGCLMGMLDTVTALFGDDIGNTIHKTFMQLAYRTDLEKINEIKEADLTPSPQKGKP